MSLGLLKRWAVFKQKVGLKLWKSVGRPQWKLHLRLCKRSIAAVTTYSKHILFPGCVDIDGLAGSDVICKQKCSPCSCWLWSEKNTLLLPLHTRISRQSRVVTSPPVFSNAGLFRHPTVMMSEATDKAAEHPDEDTVSLESNGKSPTSMTGTLGRFGSSVRNSMKRVAKFSPLSPGGKGTKVTPKEAGSKPPPSPSEYHKIKISFLCKMW